MFDRAWFVVLTIALVPVVPVLTMLLCPGLLALSAVASVFLLAIAGLLAAG